MAWLLFGGAGGRVSSVSGMTFSTIWVEGAAFRVSFLHGITTGHHLQIFQLIGFASWLTSRASWKMKPILKHYCRSVFFSLKKTAEYASGHVSLR